jgi:hypothetical protein
MPEPVLPARAHIVVIGGGVIGSSVAYHLAHLGQDVVLLERDRLTSGTTWHAAGLMVTFGSMSETSTEMRKYTRDLYGRLEAETGQATGFKPVGFIEVATEPDRLEEYRRVSAFNRLCGVDVHEISAREVADLFPLARTDDVLAGFYVAEDGRANPVDVTMALAKGARQAGANVIEGVPVTDVLTAWREVNQPVWDGTLSLQGKRVLLHCEGGLGDEILNLRAVHWAHEAGAKCAVLCSSDLMKTVATSEADAVVAPGSAGLTHYDYWIPSMSAARLFNRTWATLWPGQYIFNRNEKLNGAWRRIIPKVTGKLNIGLRWQGNPRFEHEQMRRFEAADLFKATKYDQVVRWSLQKEANTILPDDVTDLEPFLSSWEHTIAAMSQLDLVITSCTSIAHAAGALNIPTWVILPVMPYYYAARGGQKTDWYPSMRLYRQEMYGQWDEPFKQIKSDLQTLIEGVRK